MTDGRLLPAERAADLSLLSFLRGQRPALADHVNESLAQGLDEGRIHVAGLDARWMTWGIQYGYEPRSVLLVVASEPYDPSDYIRDYAEFIRLAVGETRAD